MKNSATFYVVRHGKTEWNTKGFVQGHKDSRLTEEGILQAKALGKDLSQIKFDAVFSSDLLRAKRTAQILTLEKKLAVVTTKTLRERMFGNYEGRPYSELSVYDKLYEKLDDLAKPSFRFEDIESDEDLISRFTTFVRETAIVHPGKTILVVTHGNVIHQFLIKIGFGTYKNFPHHSIGNLAYFKMETDGVEFEIKETSKIVRPLPLK